MTKAYCYLNQKTIDQLELIKQDEGYDSTSQTMKEIILLGIENHIKNKNTKILSKQEKKLIDRKEELSSQNTTHILKLLGISADILRCVYDKSKLDDDSESADEQISLIKEKVDNYVESFLNK